jgi:hypothetical protein
MAADLDHVLSHVAKARGERKSDPDDPVLILAELHQVRASG